MGEHALLRPARCPVFSRHVTEVGGRSAEGQPIALVVGPHASESGTTPELPLKMENVGELDVRLRHLVVIAILVEPGNGKWATAAVGWHVILRYRGLADLRPEQGDREERRERAQPGGGRAYEEDYAAVG